MFEKHHENSPSVLYRRQQCPGSRRMEAGLPDLVSEYTDEGRLLHDAAWNQHKRDGLSADQLQCLEVCDATLASLPVTEWHVEHEIVVSDGFAVLTEGTADGIGLSSTDDDVLYVIDWKFGRNDVADPEANLQLAAYAVGACDKFKRTKANCYLVQPRSATPVRQFEFTQIEALRRTIANIVRPTYDDRLILQCGEHCRYCKAQSTCNAIGATGSALMLRQAGDITKDNARELYDKARLVERVIAQLLDNIRRLVEQHDGETPGLKLVTQSGRRVCKDVSGAFAALSKWYDDRQFLSFCTIDVGRLEDDFARLVKEKGVVASIKDGKALFNQTVPLTTGKPVQKLKTVKGE